LAKDGRFDEGNFRTQSLDEGFRIDCNWVEKDSLGGLLISLEGLTGMGFKWFSHLFLESLLGLINGS